jgi:predicted ATPase/DNA-binding SARP family transcriptional activator
MVQEAARGTPMEDRTDGKLLLEVQLLGGFATRVGERLVPAAVWRQRRAAAIVKLLALEPGYRLHREQLLDTLWPELDPESAANNLRVALHHARRGLEDAGAPEGVFLTRDGDAVLLGTLEAVRVDVDTFAQAVSRAWQSADPAIAEHAAGLYAGDLLPEDPYEDWVAARRESVRASYLTLLARMAELYEARGDLAPAVAARERGLAVDPLDEATHASLMRLHARMGQRDLALARYARFATHLEREMGTAPERETRELAAAIREGRIAPTPTPAMPPRRESIVSATARLPAAVDALVGRERELAELERLLAAARLVTLTGPGGTGKTRLAIETARAGADRYADGVAFIDLAPLRDPALVLPTMARGLGVEESGGRPIGELLAATVSERRMLLVLDNLEQVSAAASGIGALLAACPHLTILATSRVRLLLRGEQEYPVSPLPLPEISEHAGDALLATLERSPAVELFARRAQAARPNFRLTTENVAAVAGVCRRLDGLPLAIELAAARVRVLAPDQLLRRMARPLDILGMTASDLPARQRTLRDTIAWSHDLLSPDQQAMFRRLSVFAGGWTLEGAEAVAAIDAGPEIDTVDTLAGLIDQSLVNTRPETVDAEPRYTMMETIREFAIEHLATSGEITDVERAFESFLIGLAVNAETGLRGPEQLQWLTRLEEEHDNIRAALGRILDRADGAAALSLAPRLWEFWRARGYAVEGHAWLERTMALGDTADAERQAAGNFASGKLAIDIGDYAGAADRFLESGRTWRELGDTRSHAEALSALAIVKLNVGANAEAQRLLEESLRMSREIDDARGTASALLNLGMLAREDGQSERALALLDESLTLWRRLGDPKWIALATLNLGSAYQLAGNGEVALRLLDESAERYGRIGDRYHLAVVALNRGHLEREAGSINRAKCLYADALRHFEAVSSIEGIIESIEWIAVTLAESDAIEALHLFAATAAARQAQSLLTLETDARVIDASRTAATRAAGHQAARALATGAALTLEQARVVAVAAAPTASIP